MKSEKENKIKKYSTSTYIDSATRAPPLRRSSSQLNSSSKLLFSFSLCVHRKDRLRHKKNIFHNISFTNVQCLEVCSLTKATSSARVSAGMYYQNTRALRIIRQSEESFSRLGSLKLIRRQNSVAVIYHRRVMTMLPPETAYRY